MTFASIEETAKWTMIEDDEGIRFRKWRPFPDGGLQERVKPVRGYNGSGRS